ncbi:hypothetical protein SAMN05216303_11420 [Rhodoferax sp. OV413]|nr:hypothetical protein SAMN05216303_11420 [Rhodoferax sp. OV413]
MSTINSAVVSYAIKSAQFEHLIAGTTVQDSIGHLVATVTHAGIAPKQTFVKDGKRRRRKAGGYLLWFSRSSATFPPNGIFDSAYYGPTVATECRRNFQHDKQSRLTFPTFDATEIRALDVRHVRQRLLR